ICLGAFVGGAFVARALFVGIALVFGRRLRFGLGQTRFPDLLLARLGQRAELLLADFRHRLVALRRLVRRPRRRGIGPGRFLLRLGAARRREPAFVIEVLAELHVRQADALVGVVATTADERGADRHDERQARATRLR